MALLNFFGEVRGMEGSERSDRIDKVINDCAIADVMHKAI